MNMLPVFSENGAMEGTKYYFFEIQDVVMKLLNRHSRCMTFVPTVAPEGQAEAFHCPLFKLSPLLRIQSIRWQTYKLQAGMTVKVPFGRKVQLSRLKCIAFDEAEKAVILEVQAIFRGLDIRCHSNYKSVMHTPLKDQLFLSDLIRQVKVEDVVGVVDTITDYEGYYR